MGGGDQCCCTPLPPPLSSGPPNKLRSARVDRLGSTNTEGQQSAPPLCEGRAAPAPAAARPPPPAAGGSAAPTPPPPAALRAPAAARSPALPLPPAGWRSKPRVKQKDAKDCVTLTLQWTPHRDRKRCTQRNSHCALPSTPGAHPPAGLRPPDHSSGAAHPPRCAARRPAPASPLPRPPSPARCPAAA